MTASAQPDDRHLHAVPAGGNAPPHDLAAEQALLGAWLLRPAAIDATADLDPAAFYQPAHQAIAQAILQLHADGQPVDPVTVADQLGQGGLDLIGGPHTLTTLQAGTPATSNAARYAHIVRRHHHRRRLLATLVEAAELLHSDEPPEHVAALLEQAAATHGPTGRLRYVPDEITGWLDDLEERTGPRGLATGWVDLDRTFGGLRPGTVTLFAGRPAMGKSDVGAELARNVTAAGHRTLVVSVEMSLLELLDRWQATSIHLRRTALRDGNLSPKDWERINSPNGAARLADHPLWVLDDPEVTIPQIRATAAKIGAELIVVDYMQLLLPGQRRDSRQVEVSELSAAIKRMARALDVPVVALAQLNRQVENRTQKRPTLADLRESGSLEQDADTVVMLYRDDYYNAQAETRGVLELIVEKNRHGPRDTVKVAYQPEIGLILNLAHEGAI